METAFSQCPGFYAAFTTDSNPRVPEGSLRIYTARLEAYDLKREGEEEGLDVTFEIIFAQAEGNPEIAHALLQLGKTIEGNRELLEAELRKAG